MITTVQYRNGFREELIPMALSTSDLSSKALCNAMMAISAFHYWSAEAALPYKTRAEKALHASLCSGGGNITETQAAASLMLCVYNVRYIPSGFFWRSPLTL